MVDFCQPAPPCGSAKAGAAATEGLNDGERAPPVSWLEAWAAAMEGLNDCERLPLGSSAKAGAAETGPGGLNDHRTASARHPLARPRPGGRRRRGSMTASARHPAA